MDLRFSVLISVYYKEKPSNLDSALKSITEDQILKPNQVVLIKDGFLSKELDMIIIKYINKFKGLFKVISLNKNMGLGKSLNIGLKNCDYELVARMDSDDISKPERFLEQIRIFEKNPNLDIIGSWIDEFEVIGNKFKVRSVRVVPQNNLDIHKELKFRSAFNHPTVMYKKSKIIEVGSYNQEFKLEDYYLWIRLALNKCEFYNIQKSLVNFRITNDTSRRRGGIKLLLDDYEFQKKLLKLKYINQYQFLKNIAIRFIYRIISSKLREILQKKIYREKIKL